MIPSDPQLKSGEIVGSSEIGLMGCIVIESNDFNFDAERDKLGDGELLGAGQLREAESHTGLTAVVW